MIERKKVAVIGHTGRGDYGHGMDTAFRNHPACEVVAVADPVEASHAAAMQRSGASRSYRDYRQMLDRERPEICVIAPRWIDQHADMAMTAAEFGCHLYMEKPFCRTLEEADAIERACQMRHLKVAVAHIAHYSPALTSVRKALAEGAIGRLLEIEVRGKEDARGGAEDLWVLGSHALELMVALAGPPAFCQALLLEDGQLAEPKSCREGNEGLGLLAGNRVEAIWGLPNNVLGRFASDKQSAKPPSRFGLRLRGTEGEIWLPSGFGIPARLSRDPLWMGGAGDGWRELPMAPAVAGYEGAHPVVVQDLLESIDQDRAPICSLREAIWTLECIHSVFASHVSQSRVALPLSDRTHPLTKWN
jgi:predicted dehydrogenase